MQTAVQMKHRATRALYAYWNEVRAGRRAPRRLEIQPARLGALLADTFVLERADRLTFPFRLAGSRVSNWLGPDLRSRNFLSCWGEADQSLLERYLAAVSDRGCISLFTGEGLFFSHVAGDRKGMATAPFELIVLPLQHSGQAIDRLLGLIVPLDASQPDADRPLQRLKLLAAEHMGPEERRLDSLASADPPPFAPLNVRMARIVRQGQRQFRVYQGGRVGKAPHEEAELP